MGWRQFYHTLDRERVFIEYANAHLYNYETKLARTEARLLASPWEVGTCPKIQIELFPNQLFGQKWTCQPRFLDALVVPSFPKSLLCWDIAHQLNLELAPPGPPYHLDVFGHPIEVVAQTTAYPLFRGDNPYESKLHPSLYHHIQCLEWGILAVGEAPYDDFVLIGADLICQLVTVLSNEWIMVGVDDGILPRL